MAKQTNPDYLNGVPELLILQLVSRRAMYGYELVRAIARTSDDTLLFGESCIYPILQPRGRVAECCRRCNQRVSEIE